MMVAALSSSIAPTAPAEHLAELCGAEQRTGSQLLRDGSPCFRLALHAANAAIVDAVGDRRAVHLVDESVSPANPRDELLRRVRALGPQVVVLVEQELNTNTAPLAARFTDACAHYGAILESLEATLGRDTGERAVAESALARKAANAVGREGADRLERCEVFGKWRARFGMAGFRPVALSPSIADQVLARVGPAPPALAMRAENGVLRLVWMGRVVTVASAWR